MRKRKLIQILFITILIGSISLKAQSKVGISAAPFLGIGAGPKALALGSSQVATAADASVIYWNPGATAQLRNNSVVFSNMDWFLESQVTFVSAVMKINSANAIGVSIFNLDYGDEEVTTVMEQKGTGEYWSASDMVASLNYSRMLTDRFSIGGAVKYVQLQLWHEKATSVAVDVGILFQTQIEGLSLGMSISNYGMDMRYDGSDLFQTIDLDPDKYGNNETITAKMKTEYWALPLFFRTGIAYTKDIGSFNQLTLSTDALVPSDNVEQVNLGLEWEVANLVALRAGYKALGYEDSQEGLTFGGGLKYKMNNIGLSIDYSYQEFEYFSGVQSFGLGLIF
ncbi:MAG: PorV/PorQ family protein [Candidatus Marinimicrobia bacterium]|nr:PorV/PorQ family protein [Candidatus Neomarinimicrobiota bacterium]